MQAFAEVDGGVVDGQLFGLRPQVQGVAGAVALEAVEDIRVEFGGEAVAGAGGRAVQGARAALLGAARADGLPAEQLQDGGDGDGGTNGGEVDRGQWSDNGLTLLVLVLDLALELVVFAGLGEFAIALIEDFFVAAIELDLGRDHSRWLSASGRCCNGRCSR